MASMMQPHSQGKPQLISNINAVMAVADVVRTTLGPRGTDKLIHDDKGNTIISNDGATIMKLLDIVHPAAKILADIASEMVTRKPLFAGDSEARKVVKGSSEIRSNRLRRKVKLQFHIKVKIQFLIKLKLQFLISARCNGGSPTKMLLTNFNGSKVSNYMLRQHMIDVDKREGVIDWLFDMTLGRYQIISFAAVHILDRFLSNHVVSYKEFYHVAVVALHISLKYYETRDFRTPSLDDLITEINGGGSPDPHRNERDLSRVMEKRILEDLGWEVDVVTVHTFLTRFLDAGNNPPDATMEKMAYFYAKLGIRSYDLIIKFPPEMLAAAALYAVYTYTCHIGIRCRVFRVFTGLKRKQLLRCSWRMLQLHWDGLKEEEDWWIYFQ